MRSIDAIGKIFKDHGGIMRTKELTEVNISYRHIQQLIDNGLVEKIRYGYYQWQDRRAFTEVSAIVTTFPEAILCSETALMHYGYTDRTPSEWHIAVNNRNSRTKYKLDYIDIKTHYIDPDRLSIGVSDDEIDDIAVKIYDRERVICDCLRHVNTMDGEIYNNAIRRYIRDENRNVGRLMEYASALGVEKKARSIIGIWL